MHFAMHRNFTIAGDRLNCTGQLRLSGFSPNQTHRLSQPMARLEVVTI